MLASLRQSARSLRLQPGFTAVALLTLALGIGATVTVFSVLNAVLLRPLPYRDPGRLAVLLERGTDPVSPGAVTAWREATTAFDGIEAAELWSTTLTGVERPERLAAVRVTPGLFPLLGVAPAHGRLFRADEESSGARVVLLSDRLWRRSFGADSGVVGRTIRLSGESWEVVGIMRREFEFPPFWATGAELWAPLPLVERARDQTGESLRAFARLAAGVSTTQARAELATVTARLRTAFPGTNRDIRLVSLEDRVTGNVRGALGVVFAAVALVLLIACANVAHLLLARGQARGRELAVRAALGASRGALARQLLGESALLGLGGGALGLLAAKGGTALVRAFGPAEVPRLAGVTLDGRVLVFALLLSLVTAAAFGLLPALTASATDPADTLGAATRGGTGNRRQSRARDLLVASEFALAVILLAGAGLAIRTVARRAAIDPGFDASGVVTMVVSVSGSASEAPARRAGFYRALLEETGRLPDVAAVSAINHLPLAGDLWRWGYLPEGEPRPAEGEEPRGAFRAVLPGYFRTMGLPLTAGRDFGTDDAMGRPPVVIVNRALAERHWPGQDPIGRRIDLGSAASPWVVTIVGVSENAVLDDWTAPAAPEFYAPVLQSPFYLERSGAPFSYLTLVIRARRGDPAALVEPIRRVVSRLDPDVPLADVATLRQVVARANAAPRFYLGLLGDFALVAMLLAAVGIYGVTSYAVSRRTREIGIRLALGAGRSSVLAQVAGRALRLALAGTLVGLLAAAYLTRFMAGMLFETAPLDPVTFGLVAPLLMLIGAAGATVPALRAARTDPASAFRSDTA
ncbi:MAG: ABC transporter permease [Gemmatimonadales bacterium]